MIPFLDVCSTLVYAAFPSDVRTTIAHGRGVMEDRQVKTVKVAEARARARALGEKIGAAVAMFGTCFVCSISLNAARSLPSRRAHLDCPFVNVQP